jgi:hypothetical protein
MGTSSGLDRIDATREDRDAVPGLLSVPNRAVSGLANVRAGKVFLRRFQFLQAYHVRLPLLKPAQKHRQPTVHPVHVVGRYFHGIRSEIQDIPLTPNKF